MNIQTLIKEMEKVILDKLIQFQKSQRGFCACLGNCGVCGHHLCHGCYCQLSNEISKLCTKKLIEAMEDEIIGPESSTVYDVTKDISIWRNYLRAEQRQKLKEIIKSLK